MNSRRFDLRARLVLVLILALMTVLAGCKAERGQSTPPPATIIRAEEPAPDDQIETAPTAVDEAVPAPPTLPPLPAEGEPGSYPYPSMSQGPSEPVTPVVYPSPTLDE